jgi:hypothetical protein
MGRYSFSAAGGRTLFMFGFTLWHRDASRIELFHVQSGIAFTFPLTDGKLTDEYFVAPDLSSDFVERSAAVEQLAALARSAAGLVMPTERVEPTPSSKVPRLLPPNRSKSAPA